MNTSINLRIVVMGVSGSGKSTVAKLLAQRLAMSFVDADDLHSRANREKMAAGIPLTEADRTPWLERVAEVLAAGPVVVACSALRRCYRDQLRNAAARLQFVFLRGPRALIASRLKERFHEFMPPSLLDSQYATLEEPEADEQVITLDAARPVHEIVEFVAASLAGR